MLGPDPSPYPLVGGGGERGGGRRPELFATSCLSSISTTPSGPAFLLGGERGLISRKVAYMIDRVDKRTNNKTMLLKVYVY